MRPTGAVVTSCVLVGVLAPAVADDKEHLKDTERHRRDQKKSMAAIPFRWFRRKVVQVWPVLGARGRERRWRETLRSDSLKPRRRSSP